MRAITDVLFNSYKFFARISVCKDDSNIHICCNTCSIIIVVVIERWDDLDTCSCSSIDCIIRLVDEICESIPFQSVFLLPMHFKLTAPNLRSPNRGTLLFLSPSQWQVYLYRIHGLRMHLVHCHTEISKCLWQKLQSV